MGILEAIDADCVKSSQLRFDTPNADIRKELSATSFTTSSGHWSSLAAFPSVLQGFKPNSTRVPSIIFGISWRQLM
jgi:hypothetical protein